MQLEKRFLESVLSFIGAHIALDECWGLKRRTMIHLVMTIKIIIIYLKIITKVAKTQTADIFDHISRGTEDDAARRPSLLQSLCFQRKVNNYNEAEECV